MGERVGGRVRGGVPAAGPAAVSSSVCEPALAASAGTQATQLGGGTHQERTFMPVLQVTDAVQYDTGAWSQ